MSKIEITPELIERWRFMNVDDSYWCEHIEERFRWKMARIGVEVERIHYSLNSGQGDGAGFIGGVNDIGRFLTFAFGRGSYPIWRAANKEYLVDIQINQGFENRLSRTTRVAVHIEARHFQDEFSSDDPLMRAMHATWDAVLEQEHPELVARCQAYLQKYADKLYRELRDEYDYQTSDEVVRESIIANGILEYEERRAKLR